MWIFKFDVGSIFIYMLSRTVFLNERYGSNHIISHFDCNIMYQTLFILASPLNFTLAGMNYMEVLELKD